MLLGFNDYVTTPIAKIACDAMKIIQSTFSRKLPSERYNGIMNLNYVILNPNATSEEIESALVNKKMCAELLRVGHSNLKFKIILYIKFSELFIRN